MRNGLRLSLVACLPLALMLAPQSSDAQGIASLPDYAHALKIHSTVQPQGDAPFGEHINLYTGSVSFRHEDVVLAGTGPTLRLLRETASLPVPGLPPPAFGDWQLSVPRIETFADDSLDGRSRAPGERWVMAVAPGSPDRYKRCSRIDEPHTSAALTQPWWFGLELITEAGDRQQVLRRSPQNSAKPTLAVPGATSEFPIVTSAHWQVTCLAATRNGETGEAFLAVSPDGTRYWFDHLVSEAATTLTENEDGAILRQRRMLAKMLVSRIEDRFGNALHYAYEGDRLVSVTGTDGRRVRIDWRADARLVDAIVVQPEAPNARTWRYGYRTLTTNTSATYHVLDSVQRPDGRQWRFDLHAQAYVYGNPQTRKCGTRGGLPADARTTTQTVTNPQGLVGRFVFAPTWHAHSYVRGSCVTHMPNVDPYEENSPLYITASLVRREIEGPAVAPQAWTYTWSPAEGSVSGDPCTATKTCSATKWVDAVDPAGHRTRYVHSNVEGTADGQLARIERYQGNATLLQTERYVYAAASAGPWPSLTGDAMTPVAARSVVHTPLQSTTIERQGVRFVKRVEAFDVFARPLRTTRSSSLGYTRTDAVAYADNTRHWVMGQPTSSTNLDTGLVESRTDFDATTALPIRTYAFGKLQQTRTYNVDGTLATVSDGRDSPTFNTTVAFSSWKRGVPQRITFPDGYYKAASVDDLGLIRHVDDEVGNRTCHDYDAVGRLTKVTYPSDTMPRTCDVSRWNALDRSLTFVTTAEYGLPANHWRELVTTGNARKFVYYDALLRPVLTQAYDEADKTGTLSQTVTRYAPQGGIAFQSTPLAGVSNYATVGTGTRTSYDALGRPIRIEQDSELGPLVTTHDYLAGFQTRTTSPNGKATTIGYQTYDQPSTELVRGIIHPEGAFTDIPRDVFGKPSSITRRNADRSVSLTRTYAYSAAQELCRTVEPETGATLLGHDAAGNLAWSASGLPANTPCEANGTSIAVLARKSTRAYDTRNRLTELEFADDLGEQVWTYTPDGLPNSVWTWNNAGRTHGVYNAWSYNSRRMVGGAGETQHQAGWYTWALGYGYDRNGFATVQRNPDTSSYVSAVNALGQTTGITGTSGTYVSNASYYPNGALKQFTYGNGIVHTLEQNLRGLPERSKDAYAGIAVLDDSYDYDAHGNVVAISDGATGRHQRGNRTMAYDGLDRLTAVSSPMFTAARYEYDVLDNLKRVVIGGTAGRDHHYCHDASNRLTNIRTGGCSSGASVIGLGYDVQGNVTNKNGAQYTFSQDNRLRAAVGKEDYRYDANGRRVTAGTETLGINRFFYNQAGQLAFQADGRTSRNLAYVHLAGSLIATREQSTTTSAVTLKFHHTDALGTPVATTDANRNVIERSEYEPFGKLLNRPIKDGPGYTGHVEDSRTGLTYMQQRYMDPMLGVFLSVDPVTAYGTNDWRLFTRYAYAFNNPYTFTDPDGRTPGKRIVKGIAQILYGAFKHLTKPKSAPPKSTPQPQQTPQERGRESEKRVLDNMGETKNTEAVETSKGRTIPDFKNDKQVGEIKDTQRVTDTKQLQAQREYAQETGREHTVVTGTETKVSKTVEQQSTVIRRDDLGPTK